MPSRFYVTTPIYYVNDVPHLGHAYTSIATDAFRRYNLLRGREVRMLTGTDEHGLKIERASAGTTPLAFADEMSARFRTLWPQLLVEPDDFIRTTEERHTRLVQELWRRIDARGGLYLGDYEDWYCVGCESYKTEKELLPGNLCPIHKSPVEKLKEPTYFFRLSQYEKPLLDFYARHPEFIEPESRRNEVLSFVRGGLDDLSVSRTSFTWGIPVPGDSKHIMFVWFDALANYWTALGPEGDPLRRFWPKAGSGSRAVHVVGKDILRFHAVYWPAFLLAAGFAEDELPSQVFAHGFLTVDGEKMSKSLRNGVDPLRVARELGPDVLRYQLLRAIAFGQDGDFDHAAMIERYNADLGKNLGNLLQRTLGLTTKLLGGKAPRLGAEHLDGTLVGAELAEMEKAAASHWEALEPHRALEATWSISSLANQYVDRAAPWAAAKGGDDARVEVILASLLEVLGRLSLMIWPVLPTKSDAMRAQLGLPPVRPSVGLDLWPGSAPPSVAGHRSETLGEAAPLFPTYDADATKALLERLVPRLAPEVTADGGTTAAGSGSGIPAQVTYEQFAALDLRLGVILTCERVPKKDKLLRLSVDLGEAAPRQIVAGLARSFSPEALVGKHVVVVANLAPCDFGKGLVSHGMLLATGAEDALLLATVAGDGKPGMRLK